MSQHGLELYVPRQHKAYAKKMLKEEWNHECAYCGIRERNKELTLDHVIPLTKGGTDDWCNLIPACRACNLSKGHKAVRQWYFDHEEFSVERWSKIKDHMNRKTEDVLAA